MVRTPRFSTIWYWLVLGEDDVGYDEFDRLTQSPIMVVQISCRSRIIICSLDVRLDAGIGIAIIQYRILPLFTFSTRFESVSIAAGIPQLRTSKDAALLTLDSLADKINSSCNYCHRLLD